MFLAEETHVLLLVMFACKGEKGMFEKDTLKF